MLTAVRRTGAAKGQEALDDDLLAWKAQAEAGKGEEADTAAPADTDEPMADAAAEK